MNFKKLTVLLSAVFMGQIASAKGMEVYVIHPEQVSVFRGQSQKSNKTTSIILEVNDRGAKITLRICYGPINQKIDLDAFAHQIFQLTQTARKSQSLLVVDTSQECAVHDSGRALSPDSYKTNPKVFQLATEL